MDDFNTLAKYSIFMLIINFIFIILLIIFFGVYL